MLDMLLLRSFMARFKHRVAILNQSVLKLKIISEGHHIKTGDPLKC